MKLYFEAEKFVKGGIPGLQTRVFAAKKLSVSPKHVYALVINALKLKPYIEEVIKKSGIKKELRRKCSDSLLLLLVYDLAFTPQGRIQSGKHPLKEEMLKHKTRLQAEVTKLKIRHKVKSLAELAVEENEDESPVRWFRLNPMLAEPTTLATDPLLSKLEPVGGWDQLKRSGYIYTDDYIDNLYGVHPSEKLTECPAYKKGHIIIQDRASCFPAHMLCQDMDHDDIIDATAAPGNKTTHVAALSSKVVYAFERDDNRVKVLKKMCERATGPGSDRIHVTHADFTTTSPTDFPTVTGLIVDPSCSGSGIFGRGTNNQEQTNDKDRLAKLAAFQFKIVKHALSFPAAKRVIYSTCSVHPEENEQVVCDLLRDDEVKAQGWRMETREHVIPEWPRRGFTEEFTVMGDAAEAMAGGCVRALPKEDGGIGFFAASFVRDV
ncbi:25S rRNA (cytosine(2278)-C(5))-methyltransferase [Diutina catenulata]